MTFQEAKAKLQELAAGQYCTIEYTETQYHEDAGKQGCRLYIHGYQHTDHCSSWELALDQMERMVGGNQIDPTQAPE